MTRTTLPTDALSIQAVLLDFDGTLVDSEALHYRIWAEVLRLRGVDLPLAVYQDELAGVPTAANAEDLVRRYALAERPADLAREKTLAAHRYLTEHPFPLTTGAREAIAHWQARGVRLAVVTGAARAGVESILHSHGLRGPFETLVCAEDVRWGKPAPDCYRLALQRLGLPATACVAVEDTEHGLAAAHGAGIACLAIPTAMSAGHDFSAATQRLGDLFEAVDWVEQRLPTARR